MHRKDTLSVQQSGMQKTSDVKSGEQGGHYSDLLTRNRTVKNVSHFRVEWGHAPFFK